MIKLLKIVDKILWDIARKRSMQGEIDQHHGYWWPGSLRRQAINGNSIANVIVMMTTSGTSIITLGVQCTGHLQMSNSWDGLPIAIGGSTLVEPVMWLRHRFDFEGTLMVQPHTSFELERVAIEVPIDPEKR